MDIILKYFPDLSPEQQRQMAMLDGLYRDWNAKINVLSRKDIDNIYEHHVLHSLSIARFIRFRPQTSILDLGTGGGFPGIPLAIMFPECSFKMIDGTGKKVMVAGEVAKTLGLSNVEAQHLRGEDEKGKFDFVVSRAVMPLPDLYRLVSKNLRRGGHNSMPNGIICLKGGNVEGEIAPFRRRAEVAEVADYFEEEWFREKRVIYLPL